MTTANHVLIGSAIAVIVKQPYLALPLAFASHFVLDALPHFGYARANYATALKNKMTYVELPLDLIGVIVALLTFGFGEPLVIMCAFVAVLPDFEWPYRYFFYERKGRVPPNTFLTHFHRKIQWYERPWGLYIEIVFFITIFILINRYLL